ncbi:hypothetical protein REPUB_Repub08aG0048400 [Reevesia pubescens]
MDSNGNGVVDFDELANAILLDMRDLVNQEQLIEVFHLFDRHGNGYIIRVELAGCMAKIGHPLSYRELTKMSKEADANEDSVISVTS